jgi:hypothetical protein
LQAEDRLQAGSCTDHRTAFLFTNEAGSIESLRLTAFGTARSASETPVRKVQQTMVAYYAK